jgi:hypothetical protein
MALIGLIDPSWTTRRRAPVAVDIKVDPRAGPAAQDVRRRLMLDLASDVTYDSSADPAAVIVIGGVEPMRSIRDGVPVSTVSIDEPRSPNVRIVSANDPGPVPVGWAATFTATVEARGLAGRVSRLVLEERGAELAHVEHKWTSDFERVEAALRYSPPAAGTSVVTIRALPADGETSGADNAADVRLVATGRQLKVLVHEPRPSWNAVFVRRALEADPTFSVSSRVQASRGLEVRAGEPPPTLTPDALNAFDVLVVGAPEDLRASEVEALQAFARRRGGGIVLLPDKRPTGSYLSLLPAPQFDEVLVDSAIELGSPTGTGPSLRASEMAVQRSLGAASDVLLAMEQSKATRPVVVEFPLGAGRVVFSGAMDAWRYRGSADDGFGRFWRTRIAEAALAAPPRLDVALIPGVAKPGDEVLVRVRVRATEWRESRFGTSLPEIRARLVASGVDDVVRLWPAAEQGVFEGSVTAPAPGAYNLSVTAEGGTTADEVMTVIDNARHPMESPSDRTDGLTSLASITGGVAVGSSSLEPLERYVRGLPSAPVAKAVRPARSMGFLFAFVALVSAEWAMRRRSGRK